MSLMEKLNPQQLKVASQLKGAVLVDAVPGSGKTFTVVARIENMINQGIDPNSILCTTFTKKAGDELRERLVGVIPNTKALMDLTIGTTHSIAYRILRTEYENLDHPMKEAFQQDMLTGTSQKRYVDKIKKSIMKDRMFPMPFKNTLKELTVPNIIRGISACKSEGIHYDEFRGSSLYTYSMNSGVVEEMYTRYEKAKQQDRKLDFDDLLLCLWDLFKNHPDILHKYQEKYEYVMIDEGQDTNLLQYRILELMARPQNNILLVGDIDQSMYGFRGAKPAEFLSFTGRFNKAVRIPLEDNYRSNASILDSANTLIVHNKERLQKKLTPHNFSDTKGVAYSHYKTSREEAKGIVDEIVAEIEKGVPAKDIAILFRTNALSSELEEQLIYRKVPYILHSGTSFYERKEIKDILAYLELAENPSRSKTAFLRVINTPSRYLGKAFLNKIEGYDGGYMDALTSSSLYLKDYERKGADNFVDLITALNKMYKENMPVSSLIDYIMFEGGYLQYLRDEEDVEDEDNARVDNIDTLKYIANCHEDSLGDLLDYMEDMNNNAKKSMDGVQLMTIHKSKGLEYPVVFIFGCVEGVLPHFKAVEAAHETGSQRSIEEERRLMYVAVTRAKDRVYISSSDVFCNRASQPSRFIKNMKLKNRSDIDDGESGENTKK